MDDDETRERVAQLRAELEFPALLKRFVTHLLPLAKKLRLVGESATAASLLTDFMEIADDHQAGYAHNPNGTAVFRVHLAAVYLCVAQIRSLDSPDGDWANDPAVQETILLASTTIPETIGYLMAIEDVRTEHTRRGAQGRRLLGATTRERTRRAAEQFRGQMSRDAASLLVANLIGKSPATVRRLLSEEFPGASWSST